MGRQLAGVTPDFTADSVSALAIKRGHLLSTNGVIGARTLKPWSQNHGVKPWIQILNYRISNQLHNPAHGLRWAFGTSRREPLTLVPGPVGFVLPTSLLVKRNGLDAPLEHMPHAPMRAVGELGVDTVELAHAG